METPPMFFQEHSGQLEAENKPLTGYPTPIFHPKQPTTAPKHLLPNIARPRLADELFLEKVKVFVEQHLSDDIRVGDLAKALYFTRIQVFRKIKNLTGQSPSQFIREIRLGKSLELLQKTELSIAEIAYSVGYEDPKYFTRVFVAAYGKAPSVFCR